MGKDTYYSPIESKISSISHGFGFLLSCVAFIFLVSHAVHRGNYWHIFSFNVFGISLMILYAASTMYHRADNPTTRSKLKVFDHISIYILIAGTYTPFTIVTLNNTTGWIIFSISWSSAVIGIILKLFFTGKMKFLSTTMYVVMGWIILFAIKPLIHNLPHTGFLWLLTGGVSYTLGAIIYSIPKIQLNHAIFHLFVMFASFCHFMSVYFYVLPH